MPPKQVLSKRTFSERDSTSPASVSQLSESAQTVEVQAVWTDRSTYSRSVLCQALRARLHGFLPNFVVLDRFLENANGDLDAAEQAYRAEHARRVAEKAGTQPPALVLPLASNTGGLIVRSAVVAGAETPAEESREILPRDIAGVRLPYSDNLDQERREVVETLRTIVNAVRDEDNQLLMTRSEALLALELSGWVLEDAVDRFADFEGLLDDLYTNFDHLRAATDSQEEQDDRLSRFLSLTQRPDWYSVQWHLEEHDWDFVAAAVAWQMFGIMPIRHPKDRQGTRTQGIGLRATRTGDCRALPEEEEMVFGVGDDDDWESEAAFSGTGATPKSTLETSAFRGRSRGFLLNRDQSPAHPGCPDPSKMLIEYIQKGQYKSNRFEHGKYTWPEYGDKYTDANKPPFDWNNQSDINTLSAWRRQNHSRITGEVLRPRAQPFSQEENEFLEKMWDEYFEAVKAIDKTKAEKRPLRASTEVKRDWERRFNEQFEGRIPEGSSEPVRRRNIGGLMTAANRLKAIRDKYLSKGDEGTSKGKGKAKAVEDEDDIEEVEEGEQEDEGAQEEEEPEEQ